MQTLKAAQLSPATKKAKVVQTSTKTKVDVASLKLWFLTWKQALERIVRATWCLLTRTLLMKTFIPLKVRMSSPQSIRLWCTKFQTQEGRKRPRAEFLKRHLNAMCWGARLTFQKWTTSRRSCHHRKSLSSQSNTSRKFKGRSLGILLIVACSDSVNITIQNKSKSGHNAFKVWRINMQMGLRVNPLLV